MRASLQVSVVILALAGPPSALAQGRWYQFGFSDSWGRTHAETICLDSDPPVCGKGYGASHASFGFLSGGIAWTSPAKGPFSWESGAQLVFKGWEVTTPGYLALYAEVPFLVRVGTSDKSAVSAGFKGGVSGGLGLPPSADLSTVLGADLKFRFKSGSRVSITLTRVVGLVEHRDFYLHTVMFLLGYQPGRHAP